MKIKLQHVFIALAVFADVHRAAAQVTSVGTAFTYQGRLNNGAAPANGSYDFTFQLFSDLTNNIPFSLPVTNSTVSVTNGLFTTTVDFGNVFSGNIGYWLQIAVCTNGTGAFTNLAPRQQLTPTPYAIYAPNAGTASTASGFSGSLNGDVTGTEYSTVVSTVSGQSAVNVANAATAVALAASVNNTSTLVQRDGSGNFSAGTITASFSGGGSALTSLNPANLSAGMAGININGNAATATSATNATALNGLNATNFWQLGGNNVASGQFLGSTNNQPLELRVNGKRALRLELNTNGAPNVIGGASLNYVASGVSGATIGGGGTTNLLGLGVSASNSVTADLGAIGGGAANIVSAPLSTIGGGNGNHIQADANDGEATIGGGQANIIGAGQSATISGGNGNNILGTESTVGGGYNNVIEVTTDATIGGGINNKIDNSANNSTIGGGVGNYINGKSATIPGGMGNIANGNFSFAAGNNAQANHDGAFVWSDGTGTSTASFNSNTVTMRASGGYRFLTATTGVGAQLLANQTSWSTISDRNAKKNFAPVNGETILDKLARIPMQQWNYKWEKDGDVPNIGPMAQDFKAAFYPGRDDKSISTLEFDGVELAAIQGLNQKLDEKDAEIQGLKQRLEKLEQLMNGKNGGDK